MIRSIEHFYSIIFFFQIFFFGKKYSRKISVKFHQANFFSFFLFRFIYYKIITLKDCLRIPIIQNYATKLKTNSNLGNEIKQ